MKKTFSFIDSLIFLLLIFFVNTVISSCINFQSLQNLLLFFSSTPYPTAIILVSLEILIIILLLIPRLQTIGLLLIIAISSFAAYTVISTPRFPHEFGGLINKLSSKYQLYLYSIMILISISCILFRIKRYRQNSIKKETAIYT